LEQVEIETEGEIDLRGFLGLERIGLSLSGISLATVPTVWIISLFSAQAAVVSARLHSIWRN
jgi:hypothetical protein